jgi:RimJ/RimL family protein N-acetyltransferase
MTDTVTFRLLTPADAPALEAFLRSHGDSSMFLRANSRRAGLVFEGAPFQAVYVGAFRASEIGGVAAHAWNGNLLIQAPGCAADVARAAVHVSGRAVRGLMGPADQVREARVTLGLADAPSTIAADEGLFALDLARLVPPRALVERSVLCRAPLSDERAVLRDWRSAYDIEALGSPDSAETRQRTAAFLDRQIADGDVWVAVVGNNPVSLSAFNASLPDIVQLGGIYTPPALRGRGYAKVAVAGALQAARERGATRAVLFTDNPSAERCYRALGFERVGSYALVMLT